VNRCDSMVSIAVQRLTLDERAEFHYHHTRAASAMADQPMSCPARCRNKSHVAYENVCGAEDLIGDQYCPVSAEKEPNSSIRTVKKICRFQLVAHCRSGTEAEVVRLIQKRKVWRREKPYRAPACSGS